MNSHGSRLGQVKRPAGFEGRIGVSSGARHNSVSDHSAARRAVALVLARLSGGRQTEIKLPYFGHVPPAAEQPKAANLRASDDDPDTRAAHAGLPDDQSALPAIPTIGEVLGDGGSPQQPPTP